ncbi:MAG: FMN-binding protein [Lachnospiraceae bacterium]|nr:FMN-binding protein [Lachnospiraceae bacterium]
MHIKKDNQKRIWWHRVLTVLMVICIIGHIVAYIIDFKEYQYMVTNISFDDIDLENIKDGVYDGEYDAGYIYARVEVEIIKGEIISIHLVEHRNEQGKKAESILEDVVSNQKIDVDAVSGATNSSNVIKKAIENALKEAQ